MRKLALLLILTCAGAQAKTSLEPAGLAAYTETSRDIYLAALLMPAGSSLENVHLAPGPKAMEYRIATRRISSRGFSGTLLLQAEMGSGTRTPEHIIEVLDQLKSNFKGALVRGDRFVISLSATDATTFYLNDTELVSVNDGSVFDFFFAGWVGEFSSTLLRDNLLAGTLNPAVQARYDALTPSKERVAAIAGWMAPKAAPARAAAANNDAGKTTSATEEKPLQVAAPNMTPEMVPGKKDEEYQRKLNLYVTNVMKKVFGKVDYPRRAVKKQRQGKVELLAHLDKSGELLDVTLDSSSGYSILDDAAQKAVRRAAPFPELPPEAKNEFLADDGESYVVMIPVTFKLQN